METELKEELEKEFPVVKKSFSRPRDGFSYFYVQSLSRRAWATYESPLHEEDGYKYDAVTLQVKTYHDDASLEKLDSISERPFRGIPVTLIIVDTDEDLRKAHIGFSEHLTNLGSVTFHNGHPNDPFLLAVGYYEYECITYAIQSPCNDVKVNIFVDKAHEASSIVYIAEVLTR